MVLVKAIFAGQLYFSPELDFRVISPLQSFYQLKILINFFWQTF